MLYSLHQKNSKFTVIDKKQNGAFHATVSHSPDHFHKLCQLMINKAGRPVGAQNKNQLSRVWTAFNILCSPSERSTHKERITSFGLMAMPSQHLVMQRWRAITSTVVGPAATCNRTSTELFTVEAALRSSPLYISNQQSFVYCPLVHTAGMRLVGGTNRIPAYLPQQLNRPSVDLQDYNKYQFMCLLLLLFQQPYSIPHIW